LHLSYFEPYTGYRLFYASNTNWQLLPINHWSHHEETRELSRERDNARNNARCTQARKTTNGLDGQHQDVDRPAVEVNQNDRGQG